MGAHTDVEAAAALWDRLARPFALVEVVDALLGLSTEVVQQLAGVTVAKRIRAVANGFLRCRIFHDVA